MSVQTYADEVLIRRSPLALLLPRGGFALFALSAIMAGAVLAFVI